MRLLAVTRRPACCGLRCWLAIGLTWIISASSESEDAVQFARDVQPLLAKHCLLCHGPDDAEGGLQLHTRELALAEVDSGDRAIIPGKPAKSELLSRITSQDPDLRMPPEGDGLSDKEVAVLRKWIQSGANWEVHWSYHPLDSSAAPQVQKTESIANDIDRFVQAKLEERQVSPSAEADRYTLIKRLYYDLLGLPPDPQAVDAFVSDQSKDAYERLVDQLLDSQHFGERWGRHWLDKARYADSDGYEKDNHRADAWRYRDWVINAINKDMPFDQFTIEQLAGDMLPEPDPFQRLATAFHRQTLTNTEGGTDKEQWRIAAVMDRTETLGTVWLGLSVGCARCHSHKYDQITQQEYYQLFAYFNNGDEVNAKVPKSASMDEASRAQLAELESSLLRRHEELIASADRWLPALQLKAQSANADEVAYHPLEEISIHGPQGVEFVPREDGSFLVTGANPEQAKYTIEASTSAQNITGIRLEVLPDDSLSARGPGRTEHGNFVLNEIRLYAAPQRTWSQDDRRQLVSASADFAQREWAASEAIDGVEGEGGKGTGWAIAPQFGKPHSVTFALDQAIEKDKRFLQIVLSQTYGSQHTIGRFRLSAVTGRLPGAGPPDDVQKLLLADSLDAKGLARLASYYQTLDPLSVKLTEQLQTLKDKVAGEMMNVRVIGHRSSNPRDTHILRRGEFKQPLEQVSTGTFTTLPPIRTREGGQPSDRLDLARWLVSGENPLVPRVVVNHTWHHLFGAGIVPTMNDFGVRGDPPSHPRLLDHLATKLINEGWSRKSLIKYIVMSATYRQSSQHRPKLVEVDPNNRLLHRQNRFRVEAEIIRDISLGASGLLSRKIGGPSVFPPIPPSVTELTYNSSFKWNTSQGPDRYRRGMYTYFKRTAPHPNLITFDCPDSNVTNVQRDRSNTPIGALVTLNNDTFVEAAQAMAQHVLQSTDLKKDDDRLNYALRRCIARLPDDRDVADFASLLGISRRWYQDHIDEAKTLVGSRPAKGMELAENAAWIATCRMMLNLDEFITRE